MQPIRDLLRRAVLLWTRLAWLPYSIGILVVAIFLLWSKPTEIITWIMVSDVAVGTVCAVQHRRRGQPNYYGSTGFWLLQLVIGGAYSMDYTGQVVDDAVSGRALSLIKVGIAVFTGAAAVESWFRRRAQRTRPQPGKTS